MKETVYLRLFHTHERYCISKAVPHTHEIYCISKAVPHTHEIYCISKAIPHTHEIYCISKAIPHTHERYCISRAIPHTYEICYISKAILHTQERYCISTAISLGVRGAEGILSTFHNNLQSVQDESRVWKCFKTELQIRKGIRDIYSKIIFLFVNKNI